MPIGLSSLIDALAQQRLLDAAQLEEIPAVQARIAEPKAFAAELIRRDWLTPFQANLLLQGRGNELLLGSYVLLERLGEGGMGAVFKARNWKLGRVVAVKLIHKERLDNPSAVKRFQREVRAAAALAHPNIVHAYDADEIAGTHLLVMEYIDGAIDLNRLVKRNGPLAVGQACAFIRQAALGLQHAHERGMVHRDIKPSNLILTVVRGPSSVVKDKERAGGLSLTTDDGPRTTDFVVKILDMGLARLDRTEAHDSTSSMTQEGAVMGTPDYIAPEQGIDSHRVDIRADLYSLGCTLYFLLTGRPPFPGGSLLEKLLKHQQQQATPLRHVRGDVPPAVEAIVDKLMAKQAQDRYQTPAELAQAIDTVLSSSAITVPTTIGDAGTAIAETPNLFANELASSATAPLMAEIIKSKAPPAVRVSRALWLIVPAVGGLVGLVLLILLLRTWFTAANADAPLDDFPILPRREMPKTFATVPPQKSQEAEAKQLGVPVQIANAIGMKLNLIPAGRFLMGSPEREPGRQPDEGPQHEVAITRPFYMGIHEVTVGQFQQFVGATGFRTEGEQNGQGATRRFDADGAWKMDPQAAWHRPGFAQADDHPVVCVSWNDAQAFCRWLSEKEGVRYALASEAQWEYACRAGSRTRFYFGDSAAELGEYAWYWPNAGVHTHPVGTKRPNAWGLYDMAGNVWEWTGDWYSADYYGKSPAEDPPGPRGGKTRTIRSAGWSQDVPHCRCAYRNPVSGPSGCSTDCGFRVVCDVRRGM